MSKQSKKDLVKNVLRTLRIENSLKTKGITYEYAQKQRYSNVKWIYRGYGAELDNATVHTSYRYEISGKPTYHFRDLLKENGFRWDPTKKVWYVKNVPENFGGSVLRVIAERGLYNA